MIRTAIFFGSFNPIHIGHLMLANYIIEYKNVDEMWFVLSPQNPLKVQTNLLKDKLRLDMLQYALSEYPEFKVCDIEFSLPKPSYTYNTLQALKERYPKREFILIIGSDNWAIFNQWKNYQEIIDNYQIWIYPRIGYNISEQDLPSSVKLLHSPIFEISSTTIRQAIAKGKNMKAFLPHPVYYFIKKRNLYR